MRALIVIVIGLGLLFVTSCDQETRTTFDQTWFVEYKIANESSVDLIVVAYGLLVDTTLNEFVIDAGDSRTIGEYSEFLGSPPNSSREFSCFKVYNADDMRLVHIVNKVENSLWDIRELRHEYDVEYELVIKDDDLSESSLNCDCNRIEGYVVDLADSAAVESAFVSIDWHIWERRLAFTDTSGYYRVIWSDQIPIGDMYIGKEGFVTSTKVLPDDINDENAGVHLINVLLAKEE